MLLRSLGAETTAWLLSMDAQGGGWAASVLDAGLPDPEGGPRNAPSDAAVAAASFSAHSQITKQDQPASESLSTAAASRARLRAILSRQ